MTEDATDNLVAAGVVCYWGHVPGGGVEALVVGRVQGLVWLTSRNTQGSGTKFPSRSSA
jgi:trehalose utilization protein